MVAFPGTTGATGTDPGAAGMAKPKSSEKKVPPKDGPAESGENPAPGDGFWDGHRGHETEASKKKVAKCEENPGTADRGDGKASVEEAGVVGSPRRGERTVV
jgi:hypothetical protein